MSQQQQYGVQMIRGNRYNLRGYIFTRGVVYRVTRPMRDHLVTRLRNRRNEPYFQDVLLDDPAPLPAPLAPAGYHPDAPAGPGAVAAGGQPAPAYPPAPAPAPAPAYPPEPAYAPEPPRARVNIVAPGPQVAPQAPIAPGPAPVDALPADPLVTAPEVILGAAPVVAPPAPMPQPPAGIEDDTYMQLPTPEEQALADSALAPTEMPQVVAPAAAPAPGPQPGMAGPAGGATATRARRGPGVGSQIRNEEAAQRSDLSVGGKIVEVA